MLCVQEVGSSGSLRLLNAALRVPYPTVEVASGNSLRDIHLGFLSRLPLELRPVGNEPLRDAEGQLLHDRLCAEQVAPQPLRARRGPAHAVVRLDADRALQLINVHLKSQSSGSFELLATQDVRRAEALQVGGLLARLPADANNLRMLAGDLNDTWHADAIEPIRRTGLMDPLGERLRASGRNPSTYWPKRRCRFDYLLLDPLPGVRVVDASIAAGARAQRASDHYPVCVELEWS